MNVDVERGDYETKNKLKKATFKSEHEGRFYLGVDKVESKYGKIIGKRCQVFDCSDKKVFAIDDYKKWNLKLIHKNKEA